MIGTNDSPVARRRPVTAMATTGIEQDPQELISHLQDDLESMGSALDGLASLREMEFQESDPKNREALRRGIEVLIQELTDITRHLQDAIRGGVR